MTKIALPSRINTPRWPTIFDRDQSFDRRRFQYVSNGVEVCSVLKQWQDNHGWQRRYFLALKYLNDHDVLFWPVLSQTFLVSPTGSLQTSTSDATWGNSNNKVEAIGAGGSGAVAGGSATWFGTTGGSGGAYNKIINFSFAKPGTTTYQWQVGTGGASVVGGTTNGPGNNGGQTWFNSPSYPNSGTALGADRGLGGIGIITGATSGPPGGSVVNNYPSLTGNNGGAGGSISGANPNSPTSGGGGAAGPNGNGNAGAPVSTSAASNGGQGDLTFGGAGSAGATNVSTGGTVTSANGGTGTEFNASHGSGGGSGAAISTGGTTDVATSGSGGLYGAGSGAAASDQNNNFTSGVGGSGIIVLTWPPNIFSTGVGICGAQGINVVDFGTFPGSTDAVTNITGQTGITANSLVQAWIIAEPTKDHATAEHYINPPIVMAGEITPGVGFKIRAFAYDLDILPFGQWTVGWCWN